MIPLKKNSQYELSKRATLRFNKYSCYMNSSLFVFQSKQWNAHLYSKNTWCLFIIWVKIWQDRRSLMLCFKSYVTFGSGKCLDRLDNTHWLANVVFLVTNWDWLRIIKCVNVRYLEKVKHDDTQKTRHSLVGDDRRKGPAKEGKSAKNKPRTWKNVLSVKKRFSICCLHFVPSYIFLFIINLTAHQFINNCWIEDGT